MNEIYRKTVTTKQVVTLVPWCELYNGLKSFSVSEGECGQKVAKHRSDKGVCL